MVYGNLFYIRAAPPPITTSRSLKAGRRATGGAGSLGGPLAVECCDRSGEMERENKTHRSERISTGVHAQEHARCHALDFNLAHVHCCPLQDR